MENKNTNQQPNEHYRMLRNKYRESYFDAKYAPEYYDLIFNLKTGLYAMLKYAIANFDEKENSIYLPLDIPYPFEEENLDGDINDIKHNFYLQKERVVDEFFNKYRKSLGENYGICLAGLSYDNMGRPVYEIEVKNKDNCQKILDCFWGELQKIEHYTKSRDEIWQDYEKFVDDNADWLDNKNKRI